jgi:hypothetical protein
MYQTAQLYSARKSITSLGLLVPSLCGVDVQMARLMYRCVLVHSVSHMVYMTAAASLGRMKGIVIPTVVQMHVFRR